MGFTRGRFVEVRYPQVFHVRCDDAMLATIKARGGAYYIRQLVKDDEARTAAAAAAPPFDPDQLVLPGVGLKSTGKKRVTRRKTSRARPGRRVSLAKAKRTR